MLPLQIQKSPSLPHSVIRIPRASIMIKTFSIASHFLQFVAKDSLLRPWHELEKKLYIMKALLG